MIIMVGSSWLWVASALAGLLGLRRQMRRIGEGKSIDCMITLASSKSRSFFSWVTRGTLLLHTRITINRIAPNTICHYDTILYVIIMVYNSFSYINSFWSDRGRLFKIHNSLSLYFMYDDRTNHLRPSLQLRIHRLLQQRQRPLHIQQPDPARFPLLDDGQRMQPKPLIHDTWMQRPRARTCCQQRRPQKLQQQSSRRQNILLRSRMDSAYDDDDDPISWRLAEVTKENYMAMCWMHWIGSRLRMNREMLLPGDHASKDADDAPDRPCDEDDDDGPDDVDCRDWWQMQRLPEEYNARDHFDDGDEEFRCGIANDTLTHWLHTNRDQMTRMTVGDQK